MDVTQLAHTWVGGQNLRRLACKFDRDQSERKSTRVHARPGETESQVDLSFQVPSTCEFVWSCRYGENPRSRPVSNEVNVTVRRETLGRS